MRQNTTKPSEHSENSEDMETDEEVGIDPQQEFLELNSQIDQLNSVLDVLEKKNDDIHAKLVEILKSNREAREEIQKLPEEKSAES